MNSYGTTEALRLLGDAADIAAHGEVFHHRMMLWTQAHGFQGHKRLHRHESGEDRAQLIRIQNYTVDMFGEILEPDWSYSPPEPKDLRTYLEAYLDWENGVYAKLADISNRLVTLGFPCEADLVCEGLNRKEIEKIRRMLTEYSLSGWDVSYILLADRRLHEKMKEKEEGRG
jgi:ferritin